MKMISEHLKSLGIKTEEIMDPEFFGGFRIDVKHKSKRYPTSGFLSKSYLWLHREESLGVQISISDYEKGDVSAIPDKFIKHIEEFSGERVRVKWVYSPSTDRKSSPFSSFEEKRKHMADTLLKHESINEAEHSAIISNPTPTWTFPINPEALDELLNDSEKEILK
jgi:hypothetical protein